MSLHPVWGHESTLEALARAHAHGSLPSALLIHGLKGVGKQRVALWIGQLLLCHSPGAQGPCGECRSCRQVLRLEHPDLHWFFPLPRPKGAVGKEKLADALEEARATVLEEIRESPLLSPHSDGPRGLYLAMAQTLRRRAQRRPSQGDRQVFVIADAELLVPQESSPEAANALLKLLEEPPGGTTFILTSSERNRILPTIRSRASHLHLPPLSLEEVEGFLTSVAEVGQESARQAARLSQGSIGRALGFLPREGESGPLEELRLDALELLRAALAGNPGDSFEVALSFSPTGGRGLQELLTFLEEWLRDLAAGASGGEAPVLNHDLIERVGKAADDRSVHPAVVAEAMQAVEEARVMAAGNVNPQLVIAGLLSDLRSVLYDTPRSPRSPSGAGPDPVAEEE